jgi:hypothetical protein
MVGWIQIIFGIQMYHEGMQVLFYFYFFFLKGRGEVAFSYIFNFLRTAEMISMNLGRNEVLMFPYKYCCIQNNLHKVLMTGLLYTVRGTHVHLYDGGQFLLVEERTQIHYTMYLRRDHQPSAIKLTNFLAQSHWSEQDSN